HIHQATHPLHSGPPTGHFAQDQAVLKNSGRGSNGCVTHSSTIATYGRHPTHSHRHTHTHTHNIHTCVGIHPHTDTSLASYCVKTNVFTYIQNTNTHTHTHTQGHRQGHTQGH